MCLPEKSPGTWGCRFRRCTAGYPLQVVDDEKIDGGSLDFSPTLNEPQEVLKEPAWHDRMTVDDWRGLTPLIYHHVNPYGRIKLDMEKRLPITA